MNKKQDIETRMTESYRFILMNIYQVEEAYYPVQLQHTLPHIKL